jgi:hypothetical protein
MMNNNPGETLSKSELAEKCGVSIGIVRKWCNVDFFEELKQLGYKKHQHIFTPKQTKFLKVNIIEYKE